MDKAFLKNPSFPWHELKDPPPDPLPAALRTEDWETLFESDPIDHPEFLECIKNGDVEALQKMDLSWLSSFDLINLQKSRIASFLYEHFNEDVANFLVQKTHIFNFPLHRHRFLERALHHDDTKAFSWFISSCLHLDSSYRYSKSEEDKKEAEHFLYGKGQGKKAYLSTHLQEVLRHAYRHAALQCLRMLPDPFPMELNRTFATSWEMCVRFRPEKVASFVALLEEKNFSFSLLRTLAPESPINFWTGFLTPRSLNDLEELFIKNPKTQKILYPQTVPRLPSETSLPWYATNVDKELGVSRHEFAKNFPINSLAEMAVAFASRACHEMINHPKGLPFMEEYLLRSSAHMADFSIRAHPKTLVHLLRKSPTIRNHRDEFGNSLVHYFIYFRKNFATSVAAPPFSQKAMESLTSVAFESILEKNNAGFCPADWNEDLRIPASRRSLRKEILSSSKKSSAKKRM